MNRIYQGRVTNVQKLKPGAKGNKPEHWEEFAPDPTQAKAIGHRSLVIGNSPKAHAHQLFQNAVNQ
jgi:hypothetical protein